MNPSYKLMEQIKRTAGGEVADEGIERSLALIEADTPVGALMSTLAVRDQFTPVMLDAAKHRPEPEMLAWLTLAAAGPRRARLAVARRASRLVPPHELIDVLVRGGDLHAACERRGEEASTEEEWGAWLLLAGLRRRDINRLVHRQPSLRRRYQAAKRSGRRRQINPQLAGQLKNLGLV